MTRPADQPETRAAIAKGPARGLSGFDRGRRICGAVLAPGAAMVAWLMTAGTLDAKGRSMAAVLAAVVVLWVTEVLPLPVTALLGAVLCIVLGVADAKAVLAPFADPIVFLFIGSFMLSRAMTIHRLDRRVALGFLALPWFGARPGRVLAGLGMVTALVSMWVSNTATTAMMLPIGLGILHTLHRARGKGGEGNVSGWPYAAGMMLMIAYAASIGGIGTPVGSPPNLIALGLIRSLAQVEISFYRWMSLAVPMLAAMGLVLLALLGVLHRGGPVSDEGRRDLREYLEAERAELGGWTAGQINTLAAFVVAVTLWMLPGFLAIVLPKGHAVAAWFNARQPEAAAALVAAILLFVLPTDLRRGKFTLTWDEAVKIDWGTILLFGGGLSLGTLMLTTGVADALGRGITHLTGAGSLWTLTATAIGMGIVLSEATSNTAAANMVIPVVIALAQAAQVDPVPPALGACFGASYGFMLPVSTPPNAMVYGSGLVPITKMMRAGILFDILGFFVILGSLRALCPLLGLAH